jgi:hypothetical protein
MPMIITPQNGLNKAQQINFSFTDGVVISIIADENTLEFEPDIKTCVSRLYDVIWNKGSRYGLGFNFCPGTISVYHFQLNWDKSSMTAEWIGTDCPSNITDLQKEIDRYLKMKAFW